MKRMMEPSLAYIKKCLQDLIDHDDRDVAMTMLAKYNLDGEKPTRLFCSIMKKGKKTAQFKTLVKRLRDEDSEII